MDDESGGMEDNIMPNTCEDGDMCVCDTHTVTGASSQQNEEEIPLLPETLTLKQPAKLTKEDCLRALKIQIEKKRKGEGTLNDSSQEEYLDLSQTIDSSQGDCCSSIHTLDISDWPINAKKEEVDDDMSKADRVKAKGPSKKRKCARESTERRRSKRHSLNQVDQTDSVTDLPNICKRAKIVAKSNSSEELTKVSNKRSKTRVKKSNKQPKCSSDSETTKTTAEVKKQPCAKKKSYKRSKKTNTTNKPVSKICRSRSFENFSASSGGLAEEAEVNIDYNIKFPSPEKVGSQSEVGSLLNLSLPTPTGGLKHSDSCSDFMDLSNSSISSDSDDSLPEGLTPIREDEKQLAPEELVWAKYWTSYYFPAIVKLVYKKKRKVTIIWFHPEEKGITMTVKNVLPFLSSKKDEIIKGGDELRGREKDNWKISMDRFEEFLSKRAQGELKDVWSFFKPEVMGNGKSKEAEAKHEKGSEYVPDLLCDVCNEDDNVMEPHGFCMDCGDYLCEDCYMAHTRTRATKHHVLQDKANMPQQRPKVATKDFGADKCDQHASEAIKFYCRSHQTLGCGSCMILDHRHCEGVQKIVEISQGLTETRQYRQLKTNLDKTNERAIKLIASSSDRADEAETCLSLAVQSVIQLRKDFDQILRKLETDISKEAEAMKTEDIQKLTAVKNKANSILQEVNKTTSNITSLESENELSQVFIEMIRSKEKLAVWKSKLREEETKCTARNYTFETTADMQSLVETQDFPGKIVVATE